MPCYFGSTAECDHNETTGHVVTAGNPVHFSTVEHCDRGIGPMIYRDHCGWSVQMQEIEAPIFSNPLPVCREHETVLSGCGTTYAWEFKGVPPSTLNHSKYPFNPSFFDSQTFCSRELSKDMSPIACMYFGSRVFSSALGKRFRFIIFVFLSSLRTPCKRHPPRNLNPSFT